MQLLLNSTSVPDGRRRSRQPPNARPGLPRARRVLVADPHADTVESTAMLLRLWGHDVRCASSGPEVLEMALTYRPDTVLMELRLPRINGCEVSRRLRRNEGTSRALLVAVTGYGGDRHRRLTREAGFDLHLVKPVCPESLCELLSAPSTKVGGT